MDEDGADVTSEGALVFCTGTNLAFLSISSFFLECEGILLVPEPS